MVNGLHALHALTSYDPQLRLVLTFYVLTQEGPWSLAPSASRWSLPWWWWSRVASGPSPSRRRRRLRCSSRSYIGREKGAVPSNGRGTRVAVECVHLLGVRIKAKAPARGAGGRCARGPFFLPRVGRMKADPDVCGGLGARALLGDERSGISGISGRDLRNAHFTLFTRTLCD